jgi:thymidine kinase
MAKLYFRHGAVGSAKTLNLLAVAHKYESQGKPILLVAPAVDTRFGAGIIRSRAGLEREADITLMPRESIHSSTKFRKALGEGLQAILVDEAQFLTADQVADFREIVWKKKIPVVCFGLRTNFRTELFEGSKRLLELADSIEEIKTTCAYCGSKAVFNLKLVDGVATLEGTEIDLGAEEKYQPVCARHYAIRHEAARS